MPVLAAELPESSLIRCFLHTVSSQLETALSVGRFMRDPVMMWLRRRKRTGLVNYAHSSTSQKLKPVMPASLQNLRVREQFLLLSLNLMG